MSKAEKIILVIAIILCALIFIWFSSVAILIFILSGGLIIPWWLGDLNKKE